VSDPADEGDEESLAVESDYSEEESEKDTGAARPKTPRIDRLMLAVLEEVELFRTPSGDAYATVKVRDCVEHLPVEGTTFGHWLRRWAQDRKEFLLSKSDVEKVVSNLAAKAYGLPKATEIAYRIALHNGHLFIDLGDDARRVIEIFPAQPETTERWRLIGSSACPIKFIRPSIMRALPAPVEGGQIDDFRRHFKVATEADFKLLMVWLVGAFLPRGPFVLGLIHGAHGSGKSTLCRALVALTDPQETDVRALPDDPHELAVGSQHCRVMCFDNASTISGKMSDALCRLATSDSIVSRKLYTDAEQVVLRAARPVLISSIVEVARRPDLADRALMIEARVLDGAQRITERAFWEAFEDDKPFLFGVVCDLLSAALSSHQTIVPPQGLRMVDAATWALAGLSFANWDPDAIAELWRANRYASDMSLLENDTVGFTLVEFLEGQGDTWTGSTGELHSKLTEAVPDKVRRSKSWPASAQGLRSALDRLESPLRSKGWVFERKASHGKRLLVFTRMHP
jgi:hypothetical protein